MHLPLASRPTHISSSPLAPHSHLASTLMPLLPFSPRLSPLFALLSSSPLPSLSHLPFPVSLAPLASLIARPSPLASHLFAHLSLITPHPSLPSCIYLSPFSPHFHLSHFASDLSLYSPIAPHPSLLSHISPLPRSLAPLVSLSSLSSLTLVSLLSALARAPLALTSHPFSYAPHSLSNSLTSPYSPHALPLTILVHLASTPSPLTIRPLFFASLVPLDPRVSYSSYLSCPHRLSRHSRFSHLSAHLSPLSPSRPDVRVLHVVKCKHTHANKIYKPTKKDLGI